VLACINALGFFVGSKPVILRQKAILLDGALPPTTATEEEEEEEEEEEFDFASLVCLSCDLHQLVIASWGHNPFCFCCACVDRLI
jgi:hypothetical protein